MPSYKDYIAQGQQYVNAAQSKDPAFQAWQADAQRYTPEMGVAPDWKGADYWQQWMNTLSPEQQADYLKQMNDSTRWQNKVGSVLKVAIPAAVGAVGIGGAAGLLGSAGTAAPALTGVDAAMADLAASGGLTGSSFGAGGGVSSGIAAGMEAANLANAAPAKGLGSWLSGMGVPSGVASAIGAIPTNALVSGVGGLLAAAGSSDKGNTTTMQKTYAPQPGLKFGTLRQASQQQQPGMQASLTAQPTRGLLNSGLARYGATGGLFQPAQYKPNLYTWGQ